MEGEQNTNMNEFDDELQLTRDQENDGDISDNLNSGEGIRPKRKLYNCHTRQQIQHMESFFKGCPHPDKQQRRELSLDLGMEQMQVKIWFQNKRSQMKTQQKHKENTLLRSENEKLRTENMRYREVISNATCPTCTGPTPIRETVSFYEQQLRMQNARLRDENSADTFAFSSSRPIGNYNFAFGGGNFNVRQNQSSKLAILELATAAMDELLRMAQLGEPLWDSRVDRYMTTLNEDEYFRSFPRVFGSKQRGVKSEASRESVIVTMNAQQVIEILMDVEQWSNVFSGVVSRANIKQVISPGDYGTYNEGIQVMNAEFHVPTPLVQTRESNFVRYCRKDTGGTWAVVDVSLDQLLQYSNNPLVPSCRKRPSGCIVQDITSRHSKVIWVEHVEVEERGTQSIYRPLIAAGLAFGARRWVAILESHCKRVSTSFSTNMHPDELNYIDQERRKSLLKLAGRMVTMFCCGVNASIRNTWSPISGNPNESVKVMTRRNVDDSTMPFGIQLILATSFWLHVSPKIVFDFLRDHRNRNEWDVLSNGAEFEQVMKIASGNNVGNHISLYHIKGGTGSSGQGAVTCILQESRSDPTASYVVYTPIEKLSANVVLGGGDPNLVPLLPAGFAILPDGPIGNGSQGRGLSTQAAESGGSLLTIAFQVLVNSATNPILSVGSVSVACKIISSTAEKIKRALEKPSQGF